MLSFLLACTAPDPVDPPDIETGLDEDTGPFEQVFPATAEDVSDKMEGIRERNDLPAVGGARIDEGVVTALGVSGVRARDEEAAAMWNDKWHLGSCTKAMTGTLVARLVEQGVLSWDEPLSTLLPDLDLDEGDAALTSTQLLSHQAGLPTDIPTLIWSELWKDGDVMEQRAWFAEEILALDSAQPIGTYAYSNSGYMVVGAALEQRTGKSWEELLTDEVFEPLGMDSCGFGNAAVDPDEPDQPWPHLSDGTPVAPGRGDDNPPALGPAGTVHCSLIDWGRFVSVHVAEDADYLPAEQWEHLHTPAVDDYAMGWGVYERSWADGTVYTHTGSNTMNYAVVWAAPELGSAYLAVTNQGDSFSAMDSVIAKLIE